MAKHFISVDAQGRVTDLYCDDFRKPGAGDICVKENAPRHVSFIRLNADGMLRYKWDGKSVVERTAADYKADELSVILDREKEKRLAALRANLAAELATGDAVEKVTAYQNKIAAIISAKTIGELP